MSTSQIIKVQEFGGDCSGVVCLYSKIYTKQFRFLLRAGHTLDNLKADLPPAPIRGAKPDPQLGHTPLFVQTLLKCGASKIILLLPYKLEPLRSLNIKHVGTEVLQKPMRQRRP